MKISSLKNLATLVVIPGIFFGTVGLAKTEHVEQDRFTVSSARAGRVAGEASAAWRLEIEADTKTVGRIMLRNSCPKPHRYRASSNAEYLRFERPAESIRIRSGALTPIEVLFDSTGLDSNVYRNTAWVDCLDCKKDEQCGQERVEIPIEMSVIHATNKSAEDATSERDQRDLIETGLTNKDLLRVTNDKQFKSALEVLEAQNETVDLKNVRSLTFRDAPGVTEIAFNVTTKGTRDPGEFAKLVYLQQEGQQPFVFFDNPSPGAGKLNINWPWKKNPPKGGGTGPTWPTGGALECVYSVNWYEWVTVATPCNNAPACLYSAKGTYLTQTRKGVCPNGSIKTQTRTWFAHCQC